tara:strand:- start:156 stop:491 length:336 start_codon:yes stop_codon:yes gene_type:complete
MATTLNELTIDTKLTASASNIVTSTPNTSVFVGAAIFTNTGTTTETVTIWRLGSTGVADTTNFLIVKDILPSKSWQCTELMGQIVSNESKIQAKASTLDKITVNLSGTVST